MYELAEHYGKQTVILKDIARSQEISEKYLSQLIIPLRSSGLVQGNRGAHGGYRLAKPPSEITVLEIVQILEGNLSIVECTRDPDVCPRAERCVTRALWADLRNSIDASLREVTLEDLLLKHRRAENVSSYSI